MNQSACLNWLKIRLVDLVEMVSDPPKLVKLSGRSEGGTGSRVFGLWSGEQEEESNKKYNDWSYCMVVVWAETRRGHLWGVLVLWLSLLELLLPLSLSVPSCFLPLCVCDHFCHLITLTPISWNLIPQHQLPPFKKVKSTLSDAISD